MNTPQEDQTALLSEGVFIVRTLLQQPDQLPMFPPVTDGLVFALTMGKDGKIELAQGFAVPPGMGVEASVEGQEPQHVDVLQARIEALRFTLKGRAAQGAIRAVALVDLVHFPPPERGRSTDAIRVQIEHEAIEPLICYVPYELKDKQWEQGETWAENGERVVFGAVKAMNAAILPSSAGETPDRVSDEWCGFSLSVPKPWACAPFWGYSVPGTLRCAWSGRDESSIVVFLQEPGEAADPRQMLEESVAGYEGVAVRVHAHEVQTVAGMRAMWLVVQGKGTGGIIDGKGPLETIQHWVAVPRQKDVVVLLLTCPADDYEEFKTSFVAALESLKLTGSQTKQQKASK